MNRMEDGIDQWIAVLLHILRRQESRILIRGSECLDCCAKAAWKVGEEALKELRLKDKPEKVVVQLIESQVPLGYPGSICYDDVMPST